MNTLAVLLILAVAGRCGSVSLPERERMVQEQIEARGVTNAAVLAAMRSVPRHEFVPVEYREAAYADHPLPIGHDQTISQPYIVALMTELLELKPGAKVLEVGTGSGYQAAILAAVGAEVSTIEILEPLAKSAADRLKQLGYLKVLVKCGDGYHGWPEHAPFDGIIVTAAVEPVPPALIEQLKSGGRLVIPVGPPFAPQMLVLIMKDTTGKITTRNITTVAFVPLTRKS